MIVLEGCEIYKRREIDPSTLLTLKKTNVQSSTTSDKIIQNEPSRYRLSYPPLFQL